MDRVEKVARAIAKANRRNPDTPLWDSSNKKAWEVYYFDARAAIAAIEADVREECARQALGLVVPADMATTQSAPEAHNTACYMIAAAIRKGGEDEQ